MSPYYSFQLINTVIVSHFFKPKQLGTALGRRVARCNRSARSKLAALRCSGTAGLDSGGEQSSNGGWVQYRTIQNVTQLLSLIHIWAGSYLHI